MNSTAQKEQPFTKEKPQFHIIQGEPENYWDQYEDFIELYNENKISVVKLREKLGVNLAKYRRYRKKAIEENQINVKRRKPKYKKKKKKWWPKNPKYYYFHRGAFTIIKVIRGKHVYFGRYDSLETTEKIVEKLKECEWDKSQLQRIKKEVKEGC